MNESATPSERPPSALNMLEKLRDRYEPFCMICRCGETPYGISSVTSVNDACVRHGLKLAKFYECNKEAIKNGGAIDWSVWR